MNNKKELAGYLLAVLEAAVRTYQRQMSQGLASEYVVNKSEKSLIAMMVLISDLCIREHLKQNGEINEKA